MNFLYNQWNQLDPCKKSENQGALSKKDTFCTNLYTTENMTSRKLVENLRKQNILKHIITVHCIEY